MFLQSEGARCLVWENHEGCCRCEHFSCLFYKCPAAVIFRLFFHIPVKRFHSFGTKVKACFSHSPTTPSLCDWPCRHFSDSDWLTVHTLLYINSYCTVLCPNECRYVQYMDCGKLYMYIQHHHAPGVDGVYKLNCNILISGGGQH